MFKPLRFNELLRAVPGLEHLKLTPHSAHIPRDHMREHVEVESVQPTKQGIKKTQVKEVVREDVRVKTKEGLKTTEVHKRITEDIHVKKVERADGKGEDERETLEHVHATVVSVAEIEMTPPHPPREDTPIYARTHHHLVYTLDTPCAICGVRHSTLGIARANPFGAKAVETHHYPIERSLLNACDPNKVHVIFPQVKNHESLEAFIDSEENIMVLCDIHHRHPHYGIHHILAQDFFVQPFLYGGYQVVAEAEDVQKVLVANERVMKHHPAR